MATAPKDRIEIVFMDGEAKPIRLWAQSPPAQATLIKFDKNKTIRVLGGIAVVALLSLYLMPDAVVILLLIAAMALFAFRMVDIVGFSVGE
jgi:hypothetical protein